MSGEIAATVGARSLTVAEVDRRLTALCRGPLAARLPADGSVESRQLRRWLVQLMATELLVEDEADAAELRPAERHGPDLAAAEALEVGSITAAVLAGSPLARALFHHVSGAIEATEEEVRGYFSRNRAAYRYEQTRRVEHFLFGDEDTARAARAALGRGAHPPAGRRLAGLVHRGDLTGALGDAVFAVGVGQVVGPLRSDVGWHVLRVDAVTPAGSAPYESVKGEIAARLTAAARRRHFARWLDERRTARARLRPGYEHPGDPRQPDNSHRH
ncbi:MAG: peptidyl-prolyl cis-trans isomerase [Pseudonocardiaceae bacterium]